MQTSLIKNMLVNSATIPAPYSNLANTQNLISLPLSEVQCASIVPFMDLAYQWRLVRDKVLASFEDIFDRSAFCLGPYVEKFEKEVAEYLGASHAIGVNSGTSAIHLAIKALGLKRGDRVIVPSHTFVGSLWGLLYEGIEPIFCDVKESCGTLDLGSLDESSLANAKALIVVHLYGQAANLDEAIDFAKQHQLFLIEDVAQAFGASFKGKKLGTIGDLGCFSFYPGKNLGAAGEAGLIIAKSDSLNKKVRCLRNHAQSERYSHKSIGFNYRMDGLQAAVLTAKLPFIDDWNSERRSVAKFYRDELHGLDLVLPEQTGGDHVWHLFVIKSKQREKLRSCLDEVGIETGLHYPIPLHKQELFKGQGFSSVVLEQTDRWAEQCLSLPIFPGISPDQMRLVVKSVKTMVK